MPCQRYLRLFFQRAFQEREDFRLLKLHHQQEEICRKITMRKQMSEGDKNKDAK